MLPDMWNICIWNTPGNMHGTLHMHILARIHVENTQCSVPYALHVRYVHLQCSVPYALHARYMHLQCSVPYALHVREQSRAWSHTATTQINAPGGGSSSSLCEGLCVGDDAGEVLLIKLVEPLQLSITIGGDEEIGAAWPRVLLIA